MTEPFIKLQAVTRFYQMGEVTVHALHGLNLSVARGEFLVLLGPSGSGKTTALNLIGGLDRANSGAIWVDGQEISRLNEGELTTFRRDQVGFIFQFFNLIPTLTAAENVAFALALNPRQRHGVDLAAVDLLDRVGLAARANHFPSQLSGGEQQRVAIARALANDPPLLLCDEPTGNLDADTGQQVLAVLVELNHDKGTTVVLVSHNAAIAPLADRVLRLRDGQIYDTKVDGQRRPAAALTW